ncbi:hypothetical protein LV28_08325 [Pandoraea pnomenusa]|nr:hypothetical protein LV28_08325 [Pandoraea pnomenusa]
MSRGRCDTCRIATMPGLRQVSQTARRMRHLSHRDASRTPAASSSPRGEPVAPRAVPIKRKPARQRGARVVARGGDAREFTDA